MVELVNCTEFLTQNGNSHSKIPYFLSLFEFECIELIIILYPDKSVKVQAKTEKKKPHRSFAILFGVLVAIAISAVVATVFTLQSEKGSTEAALPCELYFIHLFQIFLSIKSFEYLFFLFA